MQFLLFGNLEQFLLSLLCMSKAEVICRFSQSGFYTLKSVINSTAFQQSCQHYLTVPFFSFKKHPSCVCQEFDTSLAWVGKTYGCFIIWNMGNAWEQCSSCFLVLLWRHRVGGSKPNMVTLLFPAWSDLQLLVIPCFFSFYYSSDSSIFFFEGGAHTIEQGTRQFGVRQFGN